MSRRINVEQRNKEIREIFNRFTKKYRSDAVMKFITQNYFISPHTIYEILSVVDDSEIKIGNSSLIYKATLKDNFYL